MILILGQFSEKCYDANLDIYHIHGTEFICANYGEKVEWAPANHLEPHTKCKSDGLILDCIIFKKKYNFFLLF